MVGRGRLRPNQTDWQILSSKVILQKGVSRPGGEWLLGGGSLMGGRAALGWAVALRGRLWPQPKKFWLGCSWPRPDFEIMQLKLANNAISGQICPNCLKIFGRKFDLLGVPGTLRLFFDSPPEDHCPPPLWGTEVTGRWTWGAGGVWDPCYSFCFF